MDLKHTYLFSLLYILIMAFCFEINRKKTLNNLHFSKSTLNIFSSLLDSTFFLIFAITLLASISIANGARQNKDTSCTGQRHIRRIQKKIARHDIILERYVNTTLYEIQTLISDKVRCQLLKRFLEL